MESFQSSILSFETDEHGILHVSSRQMPLTFERMQETITMLKQRLKGARVCVLADATYARSMDKNTSELLSKEFTTICKALALFSGSWFGAKTLNAYFHFYPQNFPIRMFTDYSRAAEWLRQYL
jgi:hypothetical protein